MSSGDFPPGEGGTEHCDTNYRPRYLYPPGYRGCRYPASKCKRKCKCMCKCKCKSKCKSVSTTARARPGKCKCNCKCKYKQARPSNGYAHNKVPVSASIRVVLEPDL